MSRHDCQQEKGSVDLSPSSSKQPSRKEFSPPLEVRSSDPNQSGLSSSWPKTTPSLDHSLHTRSLQRGNASASRIRSRLLHRLGFDNHTTSGTWYHRQHQHEHLEEPVLLRRLSDTFQENLKGDYGCVDKNLSFSEDDSATVACSSYGSTSVKSGVGGSGRGRRSVSFDSAVTVLPIPSRTDYSQRIRSVLWTPPTEMQENAARNYIEFIAEGWDWRSVVDDHDMVLVAGERIHPIHFHQLQKDCSMRRQFVTVLSAQQQQKQQQQQQQHCS